MKLQEISELVGTLKNKYKESFIPYGTNDEEANGTGFIIQDIEAIFSVVILEETMAGYFDVQIESNPPGDYVYNVEIDAPGFINLIEHYRKPTDQWPA